MGAAAISKPGRRESVRCDEGLHLCGALPGQRGKKLLRVRLLICAARAFTIACVPLATLLAPPAVAQDATPLGPFTLRLDGTVSWDSNVFRVPDAAADPQISRGISGRTDRFATNSLGLHFDKAYWQQRFSLELVQNSRNYEKFTSLDRSGVEYRGAWQWQLTPHISGVLRPSSSQSLVSFEDARGAQVIVRTTTNRGLTVDAWLFGGWHLLAGTSEDKTSSSASFLAAPDSTQTSGDFGLRYLSASQGSITVIRRLRRGSFTDQPGAPVGSGGGEFTVRESEASATWAASGKSTLNGRLTRIERRNENFPARDFSAVAGEFGYAWTPTGRLSLAFSATRTVSPFFAAGSTYRTDDAVALAPVWRVSDRTTVRMRASRQVSDFPGSGGSVAGPTRRDVLRGAEIGADLTPHPKVTVGATLRHEQRTSTDAASVFNDTMVIVNATVRF